MNTLLIACSLVAPLALQDGLPVPTDPVEPAARATAQRPLLLIESRGYGRWMPDPRDRGLVEVLGLLDERMAELPAELDGGMELPPGTLDVLGRLASLPVALRVYELPPGGDAPVRAELVVVHEDAARADAMIEQVQGLLALAGFEPASSEPGEPGEADAPAEPWELVELTGPVPAWIGAVGEVFVLALGGEPSATIAGPVLEGPAFELSMEVGRMFELAQEFGEDSEDAELAALLELLGAEARLESVSSYEGGTALERVVLTAPELGLSASPLRRSLLDTLPTDVVWALAASVSPVQVVRSLRRVSAAAGEEEDPFAELEADLGVDLEADLLAHLGDGWAVYASDATGGGGLMSLVALWEAADRDALAATLDRVAESVRGMGAERARGYVRVATGELDGARTWTLNFPGLPIPMQPTVALGAEHLLLAMHPAGARAALGFVRDEGGLSGAQRVAELLGEDALALSGLYYVDAPELIADGYGYTLGLGQMLENALRSPVDVARETPTVVPPLAELLRGARPWTGTLHVVDGVLRIETRTDGSALARFAAQMGLLPSMYQMLVVPWMMAFSVDEPAYDEIEAEIEPEPEESF